MNAPATRPLARPRPLPWRRMTWVTWRQHRLALAGVVALFGAAAAYLLVTGLPMHDAYGAVAGCRPAGSDLCNRAINDFLRTYAPGVGVTFGLLQAIPPLIGAFAGAPLLAREFETGTFRYAWTQGFGRARWTVAKLVPLAVAVDDRRGSVQPARLLVRPADPGRRGQQRPALSHPLRPERRGARRLDAGRVRNRRFGRQPDPAGRTRDVRRRSPVGLLSRSRPGHSYARTTWRRWSQTTQTFRQALGSSVRGGSRAAAPPAWT